MPQVSDGEVKSVLQMYGITNPTPAEIGIFAGSDIIGAYAAMGEYANEKLAEQNREANDPLKSYQDLEQNFASDSFSRAQNLYNQVQDVLSSAPKLFGNLSPDQVKEYLAPLQTSYKQSLDTVQGVMASRGLSASSSEINALAQTNQLFQENVLQTGLQVGMNQQQQKVSSIQQQIGNLYSVGTSAQGQAGSAASQRSAQDLSQSNLVASLPYFLRSTAGNEAAAWRADQRANSGGFFQKLSQVTGAINQVVDTAGNLMTFGKNINTPFGGVSQSNPTPSTGATMPGGINSNLNVPQYQQLFQSTGTAFGS